LDPAPPLLRAGRLLEARRRTISRDREAWPLPRRKRMQYADRPAEVEAFAQPARHRCPRVNVKPLRVVSLAESLHGVGGVCRRRRDCRQELAVRSPEAERSVGLSIDLIPLLVNRTVVATTEQGEIRQRRGAAVRPVPDVMALTESHPAAG